MEPTSITANGRLLSENTGICKLKMLTAILVTLVILSFGILQQVKITLHLHAAETLPRNSKKVDQQLIKHHRSTNVSCEKLTASTERDFHGLTSRSSNSPELFKSPTSKNVRRDQCKNLLNTCNKSVPAVVKRPPWFKFTKDLKSTSNSTKVECRYYLTADSKGRLGNQLFEYASLFGIAWRNSRIPLWNNDSYRLRKIFKQLRIDANHTGPNRNERFTKIREPSWVIFLNATERLPPSNIHLHGWLQHTRYFAHVEDQLRYEFTFSSDVIRQAQRMMDVFKASSLREQGYVRVVIHVRRGDYSKRVDGLLQRQPDFFNRSMAYFTDCLPKVHFIVISDNVTWCRQNIFGHKVAFIDGERSPAVDLAIASLCDHAIITVGTFGWWVAWFANGVTVELTHIMEQAKRPSVNSEVH